MSFELSKLENYCYDLSENMHEGQYYGEEGRYYFDFHILSVYEKVKTFNYTWGTWEDEQEIIFSHHCNMTALLHDIVEDCDITCERLLTEHNIPQEVVSAVDAITKRNKETRLDYLDRCMENEIALLVKKADTLCNLEQSVIDGDLRRIRKYTKQIGYLCGD